MRRMHTKKARRGFSNVTLRLSLILSLFYFLSFSYAQTNSDCAESLTLCIQKVHWAMGFSLKSPVNANDAIYIIGHKTTAERIPVEYVESGSFHLKSGMEKKLTDTQRIDLQKPPLNQGKLVGEFVAGGVLGLAAGIGAAYIGAAITYDGTWFSELPGAIIGFSVAYPLGCALGVHTVGNLGHDTGSFASALGAAYGGILLGAVGAWALSYVSRTAAVLAVLATPPLLATFAFNKSRRFKNLQAARASLLNLKDGTMNLKFPAVCILPSSSGANKVDWLVNLASVEF
jgi:hypothetical protein